MQLVVDPARLALPCETIEPEWLRQMRSLLSLAADGGLRLTCPKTLRDAMYARLFAEGGKGDLVRYYSEVVDRMESEPLVREGPALLDSITTEPTYVNPDLDEPGRDVFLNHLGEAAVARDDGEDHLGIFTDDRCWNAEDDNVLVQAEVICREAPGGEWFEPEADLSTVRAFLAKVMTTDDILRSCCARPEVLIQRVKFGVTAVWVGKLNGRIDELAFEIGPALEKSLVRMNYSRDPRYAASCLRAMALIAGGRAAEVDGHEEREGAGGSNPVVKDCDGNTVMRTYLAKHSPDANRLFWVRGTRPKFLNVTGHEGHPAL